MRGRVFKLGHTDPERLEAFSDGVLAIVITLLVLEVKAPTPATVHADRLWEAIVDALPAVGAWVLSFVFVFTFWVAHHYFCKQLAKVDRGLLWINGLFLLFISFTPFPTALVAEYPFATPASFLLSLAMFLSALSFSALRWYAGFEADLLVDHISRVQRRAALKRGLISPSLYLLAMAAAFVWPPFSFAIQLLVPVIYFFPRAHERALEGRSEHEAQRRKPPLRG